MNEARLMYVVIGASLLSFGAGAVELPAGPNKDIVARECGSCHDLDMVFDAAGRLTIDARTGRILRFVPASRWGGNFEEDAAPPPIYGPQSALPPPTAIRGVPRPPASVPRVASQTVPMPKPAPTRPAPDSSQQSAAVAVPAKPVEAPAATGTIGQAMPPAPAPLVRPTQAMPKMQDLE